MKTQIQIMKQELRSVIFLLLLLGAGATLRGQDFNYTVSTDSVAWNELNAQTILNSNNSAWNFSYRVPIGFTFNYLGKSSDSLTIETNGYIVFDNDRNYALTAFSGVGDHVDTAGNHAVIGYELSGTAGNHILKIQYLKCSPDAGGDEIQSWQIWLKENGNVEVRVGPGTLRSNSRATIVFDEVNQTTDTMIISQLDSAQNYRVGLLNMNMNTEDRGLFVSGNPSSPQTSPVNANNPETPVLIFIPASGYRYTFTPSN